MRGSPKNGTRKAPPPRTAEHHAHHSAAMMGHVISAETRAKISAAHKGHTVSTEQRAKISATLMGRRRPTFTDETRARMSAAAKGKPKSAEHIAKSAASRRGMKQSPEAIARRSASLIGKKKSKYSAEEVLRRAKERRRVWLATHREQVRAMMRKGSSARRARKLAAFIEPIDSSVVFDRDAGVCGICRQPVARNERWDIDHVIPLSKGGAHSYENVQLAHSICNKRKWAKMPVVEDLVKVAS